MLKSSIKSTPKIKPKAELDKYIGKFLNNRYLIRDLIGKGGMGRVYLAEDSAKGGMPVALKILSLEMASQQVSQRFAREIFIGAQLGRKSQNIAKVLGYGFTELEKIPFYVMEYLPGRNLKQILRTQPLDITRFINYSGQICLGLQCAHQGVSYKGENYPVLHQDIKPENIFITEDSKKDEIIKILDFGIAKLITERSGITQSEAFIGSLAYCSPEHMEGRKLLDVRSDIYSLGILMYEMLTGQHPFDIKTNNFSTWYQAHRFQVPPAFEDIYPDVKIPQDVKQLVMSCLAKDINDRPENVGEVLKRLEDIRHKKNIANSDVSQNNIKSSQLQLVPLTSLSEKACLQKTWPQNKPVAPIGFPHLMRTTQGDIPTFWSMLPRKEITAFTDKENTGEFVASHLDLYPMLLWLTALHDTKTSLTRWLSYYLDLQENRGQKIVQSLVNNGFYHVLFFPLEEPTRCVHVTTLILTASQRQQLADWLEQSQKSKLAISSDQAKTILKVKFEKIKPEIIKQLLAKQKSPIASVKGFVYKIMHKIKTKVSW